MGIFGPFSDSVTQRFTGKERDSESGLDYFGARYYGSALGRWTSPDIGVDQHPEDPQSWNLYSYVRNGPLSRTDPTGLAACGGGDSYMQLCSSPSFPNAMNNTPNALATIAPHFPCLGCSDNPNHGYSLPDDPSGIDPNVWTPTKHYNPDDPRQKQWVNPDGWRLDWHPGTPGADGFEGKDHWHLTPPGQTKKDVRRNKQLKNHYKPGDEGPVPVAPQPSAFQPLNDLWNNLVNLVNNPPSIPAPPPTPSIPPIWQWQW